MEATKVAVLQLACMSRESLVLLLGFIVLLIPFSGFPLSWKQYALVAVGILLIFIGYSMRRSAYWRKIDRGDGERGTDSFVESQPSLLDGNS